MAKQKYDPEVKHRLRMVVRKLLEKNPEIKKRGAAHAIAHELADHFDISYSVTIKIVHQEFNRMERIYGL